MARLLPLAYEGTVAEETLELMEYAGRRMGLPLEVLERLGNDAAACETFVRAVQRGDRAAAAAITGFDLPLPSERVRVRTLARRRAVSRAEV